MSHFVANSIRFNKDLTKFQVKGGDNNIVPRNNQWSNWIDIKHLYGEITSGNIDLVSKKRKELIVLNTIKDHDFGGSFNNQDDYFHLSGLPKTKEEFEKSLDELRKIIKDSTCSKYYQNILDHKLTINFEETRARIDKFDREFLKDLRANLRNRNTRKYILKTRTGMYILKVMRRNAWTTDYESKAQVFSEERARLEAERFSSEMIAIN